MKITLVSAFTHPIAIGLRYVSSSLKAAGHDVELIFMGSRKDTARPDYSAPALEQFVERLRGRDLIGMSLMTNTFYRSVALVEQIRSAGLKTPIVWGGIHPTIAPDESLEHADAVCIGEGEEPMVELAARLEDGRDPLEVESFHFRAGSAFGNRDAVRNPIHPLLNDLDSRPFPDYDLATQWLADKDGLVRALPTNMRGGMSRLRISTARGCPYSCAFCNNATLTNIHRGRGKWVRLRSNDSVIAEIIDARRRFPMIEEVNIVDDLFFVRNEDEIDEFITKYREQVNLPLELDVFPNTINEAKVRSLARIPIALVSMGIQSGSPNTLSEIYRRSTPIAKIAAAIELFHRYRLHAEYHYIVSNPYEPDENMIETMRFIADHHWGPSVLRVFPLAFYPGTPLYDRARRDGLIPSRHELAYECTYTGGVQFLRHEYLTVWLRVVLRLRDMGLSRRLTHLLIDVVTSRPARWALDRRWFGPLASWTYAFTRKLGRNLIYQPFIRPWRRQRRKPRHAQLQPDFAKTPPRTPTAPQRELESVTHD